MWTGFQAYLLVAIVGTKVPQIPTFCPNLSSIRAQVCQLSNKMKHNEGTTYSKQLWLVVWNVPGSYPFILPYIFARVYFLSIIRTWFGCKTLEYFSKKVSKSLTLGENLLLGSIWSPSACINKNGFTPISK